jgi:hypothetical protein
METEGIGHIELLATRRLADRSEIGWMPRLTAGLSRQTRHCFSIAGDAHPCPDPVARPTPWEVAPKDLTSDASCITMLQPASRGCHAKETTSTGI